MLSEELYNYDAEAWHGVSNATYLATLNAWLIYNDFRLLRYKFPRNKGTYYLEFHVNILAQFISNF